MNEDRQFFPREAKVNFFLCKPKSTRPTMVYLVVVLQGKQYRCSAKVKVYPSQWNYSMFFEFQLGGLLWLRAALPLWVRIENLLPRFFERIAKTDLLILDDFGMKPLNAEQVLDLMEIIEDRHGRKATIIASQALVSGWYETLESNATVVDAILEESYTRRQDLSFMATVSGKMFNFAPSKL